MIEQLDEPALNDKLEAIREEAYEAGYNAGCGEGYRDGYKEGCEDTEKALAQVNGI